MEKKITSGYSKTPLAKKLGIKQGFKIQVVNAPENYLGLFSDLPHDLHWIDNHKVNKNFIHYFANSHNQLEQDLLSLKNEIESNGIIWVSWPKKASKVETDLNGNLVREAGLKSGLVDIKVCAINEIWSGLKFVIPVKDRK